MIDKSINSDPFLQYQGIQVQQSRFLHKLLSKKQQGDKQQYNRRDKHGLRLSKHWQPGDNLFTATKRYIKQRIIKVLNPQTYSRQSMIQLRQYILRQKVRLILTMIVFMFPASLYYHGIRPEITRIKRKYFLQYYNKMSFLNKQLGIKTKHISLKDLQQRI